MNCDLVRPFVSTRPEREWPPEVSAHLEGCDACLSAAIERALEQPSSATPSSDFAARVASRAARSRPARPRWPVAASVMLAVLLGCLAAALPGLEGGPGGSTLPAPAISWSLVILLAGAAEAAVLIALTAQSNGIRVTGRR
jgi:hypothetical protein